MTKPHTLAVAAALSIAGAAFAAPACTGGFAIGAMGPAATETFDADALAASFTDCYDFSIDAAGSAGGSVTGASVSLSSVAIFDLATGVLTTDTSPDQFSFGDLAAGSYQLVVTGTRLSSEQRPSYRVALSTAPAAVTSPVPEASLAAMLALAFAGAGLLARASAAPRLPLPVPLRRRATPQAWG